MKKLTLVAGILMVAAVLSFGIDSASAQTWGSYSDPGHNTPAQSFTDLNCTVYMYGEDFLKQVEYKIVYWGQVTTVFMLPFAEYIPVSHT